MTEAEHAGYEFVGDDVAALVGDTELPKRLRTEVYDAIEAREGVTLEQAEEIARATESRYLDTRVDPLDPVGTVSAQSIGEPGTQMTMNTFHYAGVAEIDVTQGLPRLIELVDARKTPDTPMMTVYVDEQDIPYVIGKGGGRITPIEDRLGISIDVRTHAERPDGGEPTPVVAGDEVDPQITGRHIVIERPEQVGETVEVLADAEYLFTATVGRGGEIQISRGSAIADELELAIDAGAPITVVAT